MVSLGSPFPTKDHKIRGNELRGSVHEKMTVEIFIRKEIRRKYTLIVRESCCNQGRNNSVACKRKNFTSLTHDRAKMPSAGGGHLSFHSHSHLRHCHRSMADAG